ncbi:uncharacterized protein SAPINGB_P002596 [Magnusiomyces paraingens]|uniref:Conserved oligomeric Golgi complex subunit 4 n=1 Tax=Magnusiomyces paraingens TaxID=2606893 RepID=A0A5E8BGW4_9ASCO|nr:uncharacterized protein SAPINGB_P002596 [Saprochaete ingens]VVT50091.1 unnamed protein product [Saprochaete ingens]
MPSQVPVSSAPPVIEPEKLRRDVDHAASIDDLRIALHQVKMARFSVDTSLQRYVSTTSLAHSNESRKLNKLKAQLGSALSTSHDLLSTLSSAAFVASSLAVKVRSLDLEQSRVKLSLQYVTDVIELKKAVQGVHAAMDVRDWERAAAFIHKTQQLPPALVKGDFARAMVPTADLPDFPEETLAEASTALGTIFLREFSKAAAEKNMETLTRYFKLLPLIGKEKEGLQVYAKFICGIITAQSRQRIQARSSADTPMFYAIAVTRLFENMATIVNQHAPIVERHYGKGRMAQVLEKTQDEADSQGGLIIDTLWDERNIPRTLADIQNYAFPYLVNSFLPGAPAGSSSASNRTHSPGFSPNRNSSDFNRATADSETVDLKHIGDLIRELSVILNRWSLYRKFLGFKWTEYSGQSNFSTSGEMLMPQMLVNCNFEKKVDSKIVPAFQSFSTFAFRRALEKALQLEEMPDVTSVYSPEAPLATSLVEDCMYMLKILLQQALDTGEVALTKSVIVAVRRILESDFIGAMQRKLRDEAPRAVSATATFNATSGVGSSAGTLVSRLSTPPPGSSGSGSGGGSGAGAAASGLGGAHGAAGSGISGLTGHEEVRLHNFLVYLNNLYVAAEYTARIVREAIYEDVLPFETDAADVHDQLQAFVQSFKHRCDELAEDGIQVAYSQVLSARIRHLANNLFKENDYMVSPNPRDSTTGVSSSPVTAIFNKEWGVIKSGFARVMAPPLYGKLLAHAAGLLSRTLEKRVWTLEGRVNELGAIQLDRDVSRIVATVSAGQYSLREKFVRVAQIVMIVGLDDVEEEEGVAWVLNDAERQRARLIRVERRELNF